MGKLNEFLNAATVDPQVQKTLQDIQNFLTQFQKSIGPFGAVSATTIKNINDLLMQLKSSTDVNQQAQIINNLNNQFMSVQQNYVKPLADFSQYINQEVPVITVGLNNYLKGGTAPAPTATEQPATE